jgi:hypothetical protein
MTRHAELACKRGGLDTIADSRPFREWQPEKPLHPFPSLEPVRVVYVQDIADTEYPLKMWGPVAELTCYLQGSTLYGIKFSHKTYRPSPTTDVTWKDPPHIKAPLTGGYTVARYGLKNTFCVVS